MISSLLTVVAIFIIVASLMVLGWCVTNWDVTKGMISCAWHGGLIIECMLIMMMVVMFAIGWSAHDIVYSKRETTMEQQK